MKVSWNESEKKIFKSLNSPEKVQSFLEGLAYNPDYFIKSPRFVLKKKNAHCFEGALLAAAVMEYYGEKPLLMHFMAYNDDHHVITLFKEGSKWGAISKTNTTMLGFRSALFPNLESLAASYFDFYFNTKREKSLLGYAAPIHLVRYERWDWRQTENDLTQMGLELLTLKHKWFATKNELRHMDKVSKRLSEACFHKSDRKGLFS